MTTAAISTVDLRKLFVSGGEQFAAVDGITLDVNEGEFFGFLGPNGAGKSTTIGMLTTRVIPTSGLAMVAGVDVVRQPARAKRAIGVVTQTNTLDRSLTVAENLDYHCRYFGMSRRDTKARTIELLERFDLTDRADSMVSDLSGGLAQRLMIARALAHRPYVLFLDEPTTGIDPQSRLRLWEMLRDLHKDGQSILLTTHYMEEADALCDRVAIIDHGRVLADDSPAALKRTMGAHVVVTVTFDADASALREEAGRIASVEKVEIDGTHVRLFATNDVGVLGQLISLGAAHGMVVRDATSMLPSLETVFLTLTGRDYRE